MKDFLLILPSLSKLYKRSATSSSGDSFMLAAEKSRSPSDGRDSAGVGLFVHRGDREVGAAQREGRLVPWTVEPVS